MPIIHSFGRQRLKPFKTLDVIVGEGLKVLSSAANMDKLQIEPIIRPKICMKCGKTWTYTKYQKYMTKNGPKISKNIKEEWYKYGKYAYMCKRCYDIKYKERKKQEKMYRIG